MSYANDPMGAALDRHITGSWGEDSVDCDDGMFCPFIRGECVRGDCELWTSAYTTESIPVYGCSIRLAVSTNSDGRVAV